MLIVIAAFQSLRTYAISGHKWYYAVIVLMLNLVPFGTNLYQFSSLESYAPMAYVNDFPTCIYYYNNSASMGVRMTILTSVSNIVADMIVLGVTWYHTYQIRRLAYTSGAKAPLATLLISDGTLYFVVLLILHILQMIMQTISVRSDGDVRVQFLVMFSNLLIEFVVAKLYFDLHTCVCTISDMFSLRPPQVD